MPSIFSRIIAGEIPAHVVWRDDRVIAFLDICPLTPGHTLVVPVDEVDKWTDLPAETWAHVTATAHRIGQALASTFDKPRCAVVVAGFDVPHTHVHLFPAAAMADYDFSRAPKPGEVTDAELAATAARIREALGTGTDGLPA